MTRDTTQEHDGLFLLFVYVGTTDMGFCDSHTIWWELYKV